MWKIATLHFIRLFISFLYFSFSFCGIFFKPDFLFNLSMLIVRRLQPIEYLCPPIAFLVTPFSQLSIQNSSFHFLPLLFIFIIVSVLFIFSSNSDDWERGWFAFAAGSRVEDNEGVASSGNHGFQGLLHSFSWSILFIVLFRMPELPWLVQQLFLYWT